MWQTLHTKNGSHFHNTLRSKDKEKDVELFSRKRMALLHNGSIAKQSQFLHWHVKDGFCLVFDLKARIYSESCEWRFEMLDFDTKRECRSMRNQTLVNGVSRNSARQMGKKIQNFFRVIQIRFSTLFHRGNRHCKLQIWRVHKSWSAQFWRVVHKSWSAQFEMPKYTQAVTLSPYVSSSLKEKPSYPHWKFLVFFFKNWCQLVPEKKSPRVKKCDDWMRQLFARRDRRSNNNFVPRHKNKERVMHKYVEVVVFFSQW